MLVYCAARLYTLDGLIGHAIRSMELFSKELSVFQILDITSDVYSKLPEDESWFPDYLKTQIENAFKLDEITFAQKEFLNHIGKTPAFDKALARIMVDIFTNKQTIMTQNGRGIFEDSVPEEPIFNCPPPAPIEKPEMVAEEVKKDPQEEALGDHPPDEDSGECPPPPPLPSYLEEEPEMLAEEVKEDPQKETLEHCFSYDGLEECASPPPPPATDELMKKKGVQKGTLATRSPSLFL